MPAGAYDATYDIWCFHLVLVLQQGTYIPKPPFEPSMEELIGASNITFRTKGCTDSDEGLQLFHRGRLHTGAPSRAMAHLQMPLCYRCRTVPAGYVRPRHRHCACECQGGTDILFQPLVYNRVSGADNPAQVASLVHLYGIPGPLTLKFDMLEPYVLFTVYCIGIQ